MTGAEALALEAAAWLAPVQVHPLFGVCVTVAAYAVADLAWRRAGRPALLNPVLIATVLLGSLLVLLDIPCELYLRQAEPINEMLALIVVLLAVPLCRQFALIQTAGAPVGVALALPVMMMPETGLVATVAPRALLDVAGGNSRAKRKNACGIVNRMTQQNAAAAASRRNLARSEPAPWGSTAPLSAAHACPSRRFGSHSATWGVVARMASTISSGMK